MKTTMLVNPWSQAQVFVTEKEALDRFDDCLNAFATAEEIYCCEGLDGIEAMEAFEAEHGTDRLSAIWFG